MRAKKVTAKKVLACVILGPFLIPTAAMLLMCYPIIWAVRQLDNLGLIDHWLTVVTGGKWEPDPEQPAGDRASNEISGGMGGLIESARLAPPLPTGEGERGRDGVN